MAAAMLAWLRLLALLLGPTALLWCVAEVKRDHYEVLGLTREATPADVKKAYKQLAKQYHPDKNPAADAQQRFIEIQRAHEVLSDPHKRQEYNSRAGYFAGDDDDDSDRRDVFGRRQRRRGPPDGGRGKIMNTAADIMDCLNSDDLWLLHVYRDANELFGEWMSSLPEEIHLGHVNIERGDELLSTVRRMQGGRLNSLPFLLLAQNGRRQAFSLNQMSMFFGPVGIVTREALEFVDYWGKLTPLQVDPQVRNFLLFAAGGSSRLRVAFIYEHLHERHFEVLSAASKLQGYAHVGQIGYYDFQDAYGDVGGLLGTLRLRRLPSVVFFDPLQGQHVVYAGDRAVSNGAELAMQHIEGARQDSSSQFFPVQELDVDMHTLLCGDGGRNCEWVLLFATTTAFERKADELAKAAALFSKACQLLAGVRDRLPASFECFWLRLSGRARGWKGMLSKHRPRGSEQDGYTIAALSAQADGMLSRLAVATSEEVASSRTVFVWLQHVMRGVAIRRIEHAEVEWPAVPSVYNPNEPSEEEPDDEPVDWLTQLSRLARRVETSGKAWLEKISRDYDLQNLFRDIDTEMLLMFAGAFTILFVLLIAVGTWLLGGVSEKTEEEALRSLELWVTVPLTRQDDERFGFGIGGDDPNGRLRVGKLTEEGLLASWNSKVLGPERRIQEGDYLAAVTNVDTGRVAVTALAMKRQLMEAKGAMLTAVLQPKLRPGLQVLASTICLEGLALADCGRFGRRSDLASEDLEVVQMRPALHDWNALRRREGASCLSTLGLGDRIVVVNGHTRVSQHLDAKSPLVLIARWRLAGSLVSERFEVTLERAAQERWGLVLGVSIAVCQQGTKEIEVRHVPPDGVAARWNAQVASNGSGTRAVLPGDRLVGANGKEGLEAISAEIRASKVVFCFERWLDKKGSCSVDLECEASESVNGKAGTADLGNAAGTAGEATRADSSAEADLGGWDVDPEFDVPVAVESTACTAGSDVHSRGQEVQCGWDLDGDLDICMAEAGNDDKADSGPVPDVGEDTSSVSGVAESRLLNAEQQEKQPEDAGWDVDLEFDVPTAVDNIVPAASVDIPKPTHPNTHQQCPTGSTTEAPGDADDGWDFDMDEALDSSEAPLLSDTAAEGLVSGCGRGQPTPVAELPNEPTASSGLPSHCKADVAPKAVAGSVKQLNGTATETSGSSFRLNTAHLRQHRAEASVVPDAGRPGSDIALWPSIDEEGRWLQHCGVCILAASAGSSPLHTRSLAVLHASFGEPEYPVRFFCDGRLPQGYLLVVLPSRSRCTMVSPERIHLAGGLLWRVLGGEVKALADSFDPDNFAACLARWHAT